MKQSRAAVAALMLLAAGCSTPHANSAQVTRASSDRPTAVAVGTAPLRRIAIGSETVLTGTLSAVESTSVGAAVGGRVTTVTARIGDVVSAGQMLVQIDDREYQAQLSQAGAAVDVASANVDAAQAQVLSAQSRLILAQKTARRMNMLYREGAISAEQQDQTQAELAAARAAVRQYVSSASAAQASAGQARKGVGTAAVPVQQATVVAPFSGVVTQKMVAAGAVVSAGTPLLQLQSIHDLEVDVAVPERDAARVGPHTAVSVHVDALGGARIPAWVRAVVPSENAALRAVMLKVAVSSRPGLLPGMFARVSIPGSAKTEWAAPMQAIANRAGQTGVFVVSSNTARFIPITTGATNGRYVTVTGIAGSATRVATSGLELLADGLRVNVQQ